MPVYECVRCVQERESGRCGEKTELLTDEQSLIAIIFCSIQICANTKIYKLYIKCVYISSVYFINMSPLLNIF